MIYAYCRVSTAHQTEENQHFVIEQFATENNIHIDIWVEETISSGQKLSKRKLGKLIPKLKSGDILITTEISRLARSLMELMGILQTCLEKDCQIWTLKENFRLGTNVQSKVLAFAIMAPNENGLWDKLDMAYNRYKETGEPTGEERRCYCKIIDPHSGIGESAASPWVHYNTYPTASECATRCALSCGYQPAHNAAFRGALFGAISPE